VTDADMVDEAIQKKASPRYGVGILVSHRKGRDFAYRNAGCGGYPPERAKGVGTNSHANGFDARGGLQWVCSLANFIFAAASLGLDIIGSRQTCPIGPLTSMGPELLDMDDTDNRLFLARPFRGWSFDQLD
jgi:hypothetical protein